MISLRRITGFLAITQLLIGSAFLLSPTGSLPAQSRSAGAARVQTIPSELKKAEEHFFNKRYYTARRLLKQFIAKNPENARAQSYLGDINLITGKLDAAEENYRIAIELTPHPAREFFRLGQVLYLKKKPGLALEAFQKAYLLNPKMHICLFQTGLVQLKLLRNKEKTIADWERFRKLEPNDPQGPDIDRALALLRRKDFKFPDVEKKIIRIIDDGRGGIIYDNGRGGDGRGGVRRRPDSGRTGPLRIPEGSDSRVPYKKANPAKEKVNNKTEDIIEIDDL